MIHTRTFNQGEKHRGDGHTTTGSQKKTTNPSAGRYCNLGNTLASNRLSGVKSAWVVDEVKWRVAHSTN